MEAEKSAELLPQRVTACPLGGPAKESTTWYLSFDCATKTFAYCLLAFDLGRYKREGAQVRADVRALVDQMKALVAQMKELPAEIRKAQNLPAARQPGNGSNGADLRGLVAVPARLQTKYARLADAAAQCARSADRMLCLADCATVDLAPGLPDKEVHTVPRIRAVVSYVRDHIGPVLAEWLGPDDTLIVLIEYQMGQNSPARIVADALIAFYVDRDVRLVGPALKNSIALCEEGRYCHFAEKYSKCYPANKAHTLYNFRHFLERTRTTISTPKKLWGHIADAFAQVIGYATTEPDPKSEDARSRALAQF
jgi:hypothetical protein